MTCAWRLGRNAAALLALSGIALAGCGAMLDPRGTQENVRAVVDSGDTDRAMAALTRGDYPNADRYAVAALRRNPKDANALLVAGLVHQGTGRYDLARQYYDVIISNQMNGTIMVPGEGGVMVPRSLLDLARANLAAVDKVTGRSVPRNITQSGRPSASFAGPAPSMATQSGLDPLPPGQGMADAPGRPTDAEANVAGRFRILKRLMDEGLITPEEHGSRRGSNLGALLPYSSQPPAQGLERPIPRDTDVVDRLRAIGVALEGRALNPREHAAERTVILDSLLPAGPKKVELPVLAPRDMIEAAAAVGRLERMRSAGLVSAEEVQRERDALERALDRTLAAARVDGNVTGLRHGTPVPFEPGAWGIILTALKSEDAARKAWDGLKRKFPDQLAKLEVQITKIEPKGKGIRWRVVAGPFDTKDAAAKVCTVLKLKKQSCDPVKTKNGTP